MAQLIDVVETNEEVSELDPPEQIEAQAVEEPAPEVPEKYRNKSINDIVKMHQEAESKLGQQGAELGELRKLADTFILNSSNTKAPEPVEEVDFFADPDKALDKKLASHPAIKEAQETAMYIKQSQAVQTLLNKHSDAQDILSNPGFKEWVDKSPIRAELHARANSKYDVLAADELLSQWKAINNASKHLTEAEQQSRKDVLRKASTGSVKGSAEPKSKQIYRRRDIIELMKTNPERYMALEPEIRLAYAEHRVR